MGRIMVQRRWHYDGYDVVDVSCGRLENRGWWRWCKKSWPRKLQSQLSGEEMEIPISPNCSIPRLVALWSIPFGLYGCFWYFLIYPAKDLSSKSKNLWWINESWDAADPCAFDFLSPWHRWSSLIIADHRSQSGFDIQMCGFDRMSVYHGVNECAMHETKRLETCDWWHGVWRITDQNPQVLHLVGDGQSLRGPHAPHMSSGPAG